MDPLLKSAGWVFVKASISPGMVQAGSQTHQKAGPVGGGGLYPRRGSEEVAKL